MPVCEATWLTSFLIIQHTLYLLFRLTSNPDSGISASTVFFHTRKVNFYAGLQRYPTLICGLIFSLTVDIYQLQNHLNETLTAQLNLILGHITLHLISK